MKWPTKKPSSSSSSSTSHSFPTSWITKFKLKREIPTKTKEKQQGLRVVYSPNPDPDLGIKTVQRCTEISGNTDYHEMCKKHKEARTCREDTRDCQENSFKGQKPKKPMLVRKEIDQMRKSVYIGGGSSKDQDRPSKQQQQQQQRKSSCKIKASENLKKAQKKKPSKSVTAAGMESFAVVKHSQDPQRDFRDSMMDMIMEKGIKDPDHMEKLLACYLRLNDDEYHDLIIKAFRQVWCEFDHIRALNHQFQEVNLVSDN